MAEALAGKSSDPCVGKFLEFRIVRNPAQPDESKVPAIHDSQPRPRRTSPWRARASFEFNSGASQNQSNPIPLPHRRRRAVRPMGRQDRQYRGHAAMPDFGRISAAPQIWHARRSGHCATVAAAGTIPSTSTLKKARSWPATAAAATCRRAEKGRKDVYRLRPSGSVTITMQFRDWGGMFMEHCHNTVHEDNAMLLRWETKGRGAPFLRSAADAHLQHRRASRSYRRMKFFRRPEEPLERSVTRLGRPSALPIHCPAQSE